MSSNFGRPVNDDIVDLHPRRNRITTRPQPIPANPVSAPSPQLSSSHSMVPPRDGGSAPSTPPHVETTGPSTPHNASSPLSTSSPTEQSWPTVPYNPERHSARPRRNGERPQTRMDRMDNIIISALTFSCAFFDRPTGERFSYDEKSNKIIGPFVLPPKKQHKAEESSDESCDEEPTDAEIREFKEIAEVFLLGRKKLLAFRRKHPNFK